MYNWNSLFEQKNKRIAAFMDEQNTQKRNR